MNASFINQDRQEISVPMDFANSMRSIFSPYSIYCIGRNKKYWKTLWWFRVFFSFLRGCFQHRPFSSFFSGLQLEAFCTRQCDRPSIGSSDVQSASVVESGSNPSVLSSWTAWKKGWSKEGWTDRVVFSTLCPSFPSARVHCGPSFPQSHAHTIFIRLYKVCMYNSIEPSPIIHLLWLKYSQYFLPS